MASNAKRARRAMKRVTMAWRNGLITHSPDWMKRRFGPSASYLDMLFVDHGIFRLAYANIHQLSDQAWRSAQPAPHDIARLARRGVRTIVNLRGHRICGSYALEQRACKAHGIELINFTVRSRAAPTPEELHGARELFQTIEYPMLMHCKSGADRAGLMSVLYRHCHEGWPIEKATQELSFRYGHFRQADTGVLDYFFERYLEDNARQAISFFDWVDTNYDPDEVKASFRAQGWANRVVDSILRRE